MSDELTEISFLVPEDTKYRVRRIALEDSDPGDRTTMSDIGREALADYLDVPVEEIEP